MKENTKVKLEEFKNTVAKKFEDGLATTYIWINNHPVLATAIGTLTGALVTAGVHAIVDKCKPVPIPIDANDDGTYEWGGGVFETNPNWTFSSSKEACNFVNRQFKSIDRNADGYFIEKTDNGYNVLFACDKFPEE